MFVKPAPWLRFAAGAEVRANSHDQVEDGWRVDIGDRGLRRPRASVRRLVATFTRGPLTIDAGKQFIRWAKPTSSIHRPVRAARFPERRRRDFLAVTGVRGVVQVDADTIEVVWLPRFTASRVPLLDQRWTAVPAGAASVPLVDGGATFPERSQTGVRYGHVGAAFEYSLSVFDGLNHLPNIQPSLAADPASFGSASSVRVQVARVYPRFGCTAPTGDADAVVHDQK